VIDLLLEIGNCLIWEIIKSCTCEFKISIWFVIGRRLVSP
jgi:hypothetical protein